MKATVTGMHMDAPEGKWVPGGGIEIPRGREGGAYAGGGG